MKHQCQFEATSCQEATRALIAGFNRTVQLLNSAITAEESQIGIFDRLQAENPSYAGELDARRANLMNTVAALGQRTQVLPPSDTQTSRL
jgi:hypothetical protein